MPSDYLPVPHRKQKGDAMCLPDDVVVVGLTADTILVNDPSFDNAPIRVPLDEFLLAWCEFEYKYAIIK